VLHLHVEGILNHNAIDTSLMVPPVLKHDT